jgi:hypothetical protein
MLQLRRADKLLIHFAQHMVPLLVYENIRQADGTIHNLHGAASGFVAQVGESCWLFTAGHVIKWLQEAHAAGRLSHIHACDTWKHENGTGTPVPIPINHFNWVLLGTEKNPPDLGAIRLEQNTIDLMRVGNIEPVAESDWDTIPDQFDFFQVLGSPGELNIVEEGRHAPAKITIGRSLVNVRKIDRPSYAPAFPFERFYGQLDVKAKTPRASDTTLDSIAGMSGGPILGCERIENNILYWLIGVQSSWFPNEKVITADYAKTLYDHLKKL